MTVVLTAMNRFINEADGSQTAFLDGNQPERLCEPMKKHIEARGGEVRTSSPVKENLDGLRIGAFEAAQLCNSYSPGKTPLMGVLDLPFLPAPNPDVTQNMHEAVFAHSGSGIRK